MKKTIAAGLVVAGVLVAVGASPASAFNGNGGRSTSGCTQAHYRCK